MSSFGVKESNKIFYCLTPDFGLIRFTAQGIRKNESKLKQSVQDFSYAKIALVYGKNGWILTNSDFIKSYFYTLKERDTEMGREKAYNEEKIKVVAKIFSLIKRMVPEEDSELQIFDLIKNALEFLEKENRTYLISFEIGVVAMILKKLGYIDDAELKENFNTEIKLLCGYAIENKENLLKKINNAIKESHL